MSVNVCLDDIFLTTEHFVTKRGVVMQQHKPECSVKNNTAIKVKVTAKRQIVSVCPDDVF